MTASSNNKHVVALCCQRFSIDSSFQIYNTQIFINILSFSYFIEMHNVKRFRLILPSIHACIAHSRTDTREHTVQCSRKNLVKDGIHSCAYSLETQFYTVCYTSILKYTSDWSRNTYPNISLV